MYYVNKKHLVTVEKMNEDFTLHTFGGEELGSAGDYIGKHENGDRESIPKEVYDEEFVAVEVVQKGNIDLEKRKMFEQNAYDVGRMNQVEGKEYIENMKKLVEDKAF